MQLPTSTPRVIIALAVLWMSAYAAACGPNCQSTCNKLYQENECNLQSAGKNRTQLLSQCNDECEDALQHPGEVREEFKPNEYTPSSKSVHLETDREAAMWMDCITDHDCQLLGEGYCAPIW